MLRQRIITALILLAILLPVLFARPVWPFALVTLVAVGAAGWEWARLNGLSGVAAVACGAAVGAVGSVAMVLGWMMHPPAHSWWFSVAAWIAGGAWVLQAGVSAWPNVPQPLRVAIGLVLLWSAWLALCMAKALGIGFLLSIFCLVWAADIAAYFGGRAFGRRKLAPSISPGKSWEGAWCGAAAAAMLAVAWVMVDRRVHETGGSLFETLFAGYGGVGMVVAVAGLAALSVVGDLFESLVKRAAGAKDSSALLPGHGGVLDRIDALLPVFPAALALQSLT